MHQIAFNSTGGVQTSFPGVSSDVDFLNILLICIWISSHEIKEKYEMVGKDSNVLPQIYFTSLQQLVALLLCLLSICGPDL